MINWSVSDTYQNVEPFNLVDLCLIELFEIELFDHLNVSFNKMCLQIIYLIYM